MDDSLLYQSKNLLLFMPPFFLYLFRVLKSNYKDLIETDLVTVSILQSTNLF